MNVDTCSCHLWDSTERRQTRLSACYLYSPKRVQCFLSCKLTELKAEYNFQPHKGDNQLLVWDCMQLEVWICNNPHRSHTLLTLQYNS